MDQVLEHAAGDLVVAVQAGIRLDELAKVLATAGQRLAIDSPASAGGSSGTVGGLIATGAAGPLRYRYGSPRDLMIGITVVRADGTVAKSGGKVVKNVAGYDIGKLFAGSLGTLGLITEATFRLHPLPEAAAWITLDCPDTRRQHQWSGPSPTHRWPRPPSSSPGRVRAAPISISAPDSRATPKSDRRAGPIVCESLHRAGGARGRRGGGRSVSCASAAVRRS